MADARIVRNRAKVNAFIGNAGAWLRVDDPARLIWSYVDDRLVMNRWRTMDEVPSETDGAPRDLRERGFRFVGPTICYALMQSAGLVNDHVLDCHRHAEVAE
ncbi:MAG: DNA-3-methyladenine glycosylase I [Candidatus Limnocylindria bacterium]